MQGGRLWVVFEDGNRMVPPPAERTLIISDYHT